MYSGVYRTYPIASLLVENGKIPLANVVIENMAIKAMRTLQGDRALGYRPTVCKAKMRWDDLTEIDIPSDLDYGNGHGTL